MWKIEFVIILTFSILAGISLSGTYQPVLAQEDATSNISSNSTGIMQNTSGMIDDAFDALKNSFAKLFGAN